MQGAAVCDVFDETIRRNADASDRGRPLGKTGATWLIGWARLLDYVEKHQGG